MKTASEAAQATGLPPNVVPWEPGVKTSDSAGDAMRAPSGSPPPRALADVNASGAYPAMAQAFVNFMGTGFRYVNREDDAGDEGIRYSKLNYKPIELIPKYLVTILA